MHASPCIQRANVEMWTIVNISNLHACWDLMNYKPPIA